MQIWSEHAEWPEYFFLPVILLILITLLNDGTMIAIGYDNVVAPTRPAKVRPISCCMLPRTIDMMLCCGLMTVSPRPLALPRHAPRYFSVEFVLFWHGDRSQCRFYLYFVFVVVLPGFPGMLGTN